MSLLNTFQVVGQTVTVDTLIAHDTITNLNSNDLAGLWFSWGYIIDHTNKGHFLDDNYERVESPVYLYFEKDSVWAFQYPCQKLFVHSFSGGDWMIVDDELRDNSGRSYTRVDFDTAIVGRLKVERIIPDCYTGKWELVRTVSGGDGTGVEFIFPFIVNDTLVLQHDQLIEPNLVENKIHLFIGGTKREFYFTLSQESFHYKLVLWPTETWADSEKKMWLKSWDDPPLTEGDLKKLKETEGVDLELVFFKTL